MMFRGAEAPFELGGVPVRMVAFIHDTLAPLPWPSPQTTSAAGLEAAANGNWAIGPRSLRATGATMSMWRSHTWDAPATAASINDCTSQSLTGPSSQFVAVSWVCVN